MKITTKHRIEYLNAKDARLMVSVIVDGKLVGAPIVVASGPAKPIEAYVAGKITIAELEDRILNDGKRIMLSGTRV